MIATELPTIQEENGSSFRTGITFRWSPNRSSHTQSLPEQIAERVGNKIIAGSLKPGVRIQEQALANEFSVSRGPVREALRILEKDGLVKIEPRRGVQVTQLSVEEVSDIFEIRAGLLGVGAKLAAELGDRKNIERIDRLLKNLDAAFSADDVDQFVANAHMLSLLVAEASGNPRLADMIFSLAHQTLRYARLGLSTRERRQQSLKNWHRLASAVKDGDSEVAKIAAERLVQDSKAKAVRLLTEEEARTARKSPSSE